MSDQLIITLEQTNAVSSKKACKLIDRFIKENDMAVASQMDTGNVSKISTVSEEVVENLKIISNELKLCSEDFDVGGKADKSDKGGKRKRHSEGGKKKSKKDNVE